MKVGADAVLLGSLADTGKACKILDIGAGCGIISLMLAQRSNAEIVAIDIDENSVIEAASNFKKSPWAARLKILHTSLCDFSKTSLSKYDLIVSNPPYFQNDLLPSSQKLQIAKHATTLSFDAFIIDANRLLVENGRIAVILPASEADIFTKKCLMEKLYLDRFFEIVPREGKKANRLILNFSKYNTKTPEKFDLTIRDKNGQYTQQYKDLTAQFHPPHYFKNQA
jgi:tRNA1Val (adenine37-N6)-methyltransferase